ncbi:molybdenum cofactor guanylyltransferase [Paraferrimonas sp. SM1919]|uniref:molybdenum cofactor guanylyltransferase n=1 Tax=Paraferrimonas sp. SM1919 TaxID=2662263 RepID=UPI0013D2B27B|nr:molybdenum cofactor guanylyltransferase [Paraferrimonas sp. SM1919]
MLEPVVGVVLAGGKSSRMGQDKAALVYHGRTLLEHSHHTLTLSGIHQVYYSHPEHIGDSYQNMGPLGGIYSSMLALEEHAYLLFMAVDMPLVLPSLLQQLIVNQHAQGVHFIDNPLPFMLVNNGTTQALLKQRLDEGKDLAIAAFLKDVGALALETSQRQQLINVNTPSQWQQLP